MTRPGILILLGTLVLAPAALPQERESVRESRVRETLLQCEDAPIAKLWALSDSLVEMGVPARRIILKAVADTSVEGKLCALRALIELDSTTFAASELLKIASDEEMELEHRLVALELIGLSEEPDAEDGLLELIFALDPKIQLASARALWRMPTPRRSKAKEVFKEFLKSEDPDLRAEGALALAEIGDYRQPGVREALRTLASEPGIRGKLAAAYISKLSAVETVARLERRIEAAKTGRRGSDEWKHLDEIVRLLRELYDIPDRISHEDLKKAAARGLLTIPGDAHTAFMDPTEHTQWNEEMDPSYGGIGALIDTNAKDFRILRPFFGGPAWKTDIRTGDRIVAVNGKDTLGRDQVEIIREIKGPPGTDVVLTIYRDGWDDTKEVKVTRAKIVLPTVTSRMLPGKIGLIEIAQFGEETGLQFRKQLDALENDEMRGLVIDLRWNPGGSLDTVKECLTPFLKAGEHICTVRGRSVGKGQKHYAGKPGKKRTYPISVLINQRSASGSELMSGALQHYSTSSDRALAKDPYVDAIVLGKPSFGKGTVQFKISLRSWPGEKFRDVLRKNGEWDERETLTVDKNGNGSWDPGEEFVDSMRRNGVWDDAESFDDDNGNGKWEPGEEYEDRNRDGEWNPAEQYTDTNKNGEYDYGAAMRLTVARYYLPSGKNFTRTPVKRDGKTVFEGGVIPDFDLDPERMKASHRAEFFEIQQTNKLRDYVRARWADHKDTFRKLAYFDGRDPSQYPDFDDLHDALDTRLTKQELRRALRIEVRRAVANEIGSEIHGDLSDDVVLRRGVLEILRRLEVDPTTVPEYAELGK